MNYKLLLFISLIFGANVTAQSTDPFWRPAQAQEVKQAKRDVYPQQFFLTHLDLEELKQHLQKAPLEFTAKAKKPLSVVLPMPNGTLETFRVVASPVMRPGLAAKYPHIRTFAGESENGEMTARFGYGDQGFHAIISHQGARIYIDPYAKGQSAHYMVYYTNEYQLDQQLTENIPALSCGWEPEENAVATPKSLPQGGEKSTGGQPVDLRVYEMALACTGEYAANHGGTVSSVLSSFNTAVNRVNEILQTETAVKFELVDNNEALIFLNAGSDPFTNSNNGGALLDQIQGVLNTVIGFNNYDIGHVFTQACTDVGGVAGGTVCNQNKGRGVTCHFSPNIIFIAEEIMAHELAHQFSANHSWSNCPGNGGQIAFGSAYEPGSGSTIMSYSGSCGDQNIQFGSDTYYHVVNLEEIINFSRVAAGSGCPDVIPTDNNEPTIDLHYEDGFFIPISTPFELTATAEDPDGDIITYCWEQFDRGPISPIGQPTGNTPLFRSFPPNTSPTRTFPRLQALLGNFSENSEVLPTYSRAMTFRCSVRDSDPLAGGSVWETVAFQATDQAGPFLVQQPNSSATEWVGGEKVEVQWDVANTDAAPVNCQAVSILLSTDGGFTYPYTLANGIPNTGSAEVFVPNVTTNSARIKVAATYNVFFDVSNANFSISEAQEPGYGVSIAEPSIQQICVPETYDLSFVTSSFAGYSEQVSIEIIEGLPSYVDASFSANPVPAGETSVLNLDFSEVEEEEIIDLVFQITAPGQDPVELTASLDLVLTDFSNLAMLNPANGVGNLSIGNGTFVWTDIPNANSYDVQISDSPVFEESIIDEATDLSGNEFSISVALDENTLYYWRIRPKNECGYGEWLPPFAFHTENVICEKYDALDLPLGIPAVGLPTKTSTLTVVEAGTITDINVINLKGNHDAINDIEMRLQGPDETEVVLFSKICGNTAPFNMGFDDESPLEISCPPNVGQPYQPEEALAAFDGTNIQGDWKLHVEVIDDFGAGGLVETWGLEFCAGFSPQSPELIVNEPLLVKNGAFNYLSNEVLLATDPDNTAEELKYTLVSVPQFGTLKWFDNELSVGDTYLQVQVDAFHLRYFNDNGGTDSDSFTFVIEDGTGGFVGITQFDIILDPDAPVATSEPSPKPKIALFPNPNNGQATILLPFEADQEVLIQVSDMQGRILHQQQAGQGSRQIELNIPELPGGLYLVSVRMGDRMFVEKMVVE